VTDAELVAKKLAFIETCVAELRSLARPDLIESDVRERRFVEHTLQIAIQAVQDVASHIVSEERLGEPRTNQELLERMSSAGWLEPPLALALRRAVGLRNVLVHGYTGVDPQIVREVVENRLDELLAFAVAVRSRLP